MNKKIITIHKKKIHKIILHTKKNLVKNHKKPKINEKHHFLNNSKKKPKFQNKQQLMKKKNLKIKAKAL
jgi:hypothetical protein